MRIGPIPKDCPIDMVEEAPSSTSFLQISSRVKLPLPPPVSSSASIPAVSFSGVTARKEDVTIQPHVQSKKVSSQPSPTKKSGHELDLARMSFLQISEGPMKLSEPVG